ncbi:MAG: hypothetical protein KAS23_08415, partial [Anaerohalosphaera sp.]|nr:hypothetical protein [Anaerohalosphaera sp.]
MPGRGLPIIISRTYGSRREYNSRFGYGWDMNYNMKIRELDVVGEVALLDGKGNRRYYEQDSLDTTRFIRFDDRSDYIISNGGAATYPFELVKKSGGIHYKFDLNGNLAKITDRNGNEITLEYDATLQEINGYSPFFQKEENGGPANRHGLVASEYKLRAVYDSLSRRLDFEYDDDGAGTSGVLTRIVEKLNGNPTGRDWIYEYDASYNNLRFVKGPEVTDPETSQLYRPTTEYLYDEGTSGYPTALKEIYDPINFDNSGDAKKPYLVNYYFNPLTLDDYIYPKIDFQSYGESADADDSIYELSYDTDSQRSIVYDRQKVNSPAIPKSYTVTAFNDSGQTASETVVANASDEYPDKTLRAYSTSYEYNQYNEVKKVILPKRNCIEYIYEDDSSSFLNVDKLTVIQRPECDVLPFNGSSDYVKVLDHEVTDNDYDFATSDFSVALWAKRTTVNSPEYLLYRVDSATGYGWSLKFDSNTNPSSTNHVVLTVDGVDVISSSIIADGDWHYIVASVDRDGSSGIYIDGGPIENYNSTSITTGTAAIADLYMGCSYDGSTYGDYFKGSIDEVMILDRSLDREDCFGLTINSQGLIGYWKMDETSGTSIADTTPRDISESPKNGSVNPIRTIQAMLSGGAVAGEIKVVYDYTQHNGLDYVDTVTDSKGNVISYKYDFEGTYPTNVGNLMEITYPSARVASRNATDGLDYSWESSYAKFEYNNYGQISKMTVLNDLATSTELVTQYDYYPDTASDENEGRPWKVTIDPSGENIVTEFSYDIYGHMNTTTLDPIGQGNSQDLIISEKLFNALDQIVKITDPLSLDTYFEHNKNDKLKRIKRAFTDGDNAPQTQMIEYSYDLLDNLKTVQDSLGYITENFYDGNENVIAVVDAEGAVADYETDIFYDERGLVYKTVDAKGNATTYSYDANGHLELITDAKSQETSYEYDIFGRPVKTVYPDNSTEESGYDSRDVAWSKNRAGDYFYFDYDALGRVIRKIVETASAATTIEIDDDPAPGAIGWAQSSAALGKYGQSYYYAAESGKTCDFQSSGSLTGSYTIYMWWPEDATAESVTVSVTGASDITINQNQNNSQWYELGTYNFNSQVTVTITSGSTGITCADAVRFVPTSHDITDYSYDIAGRLLQVDDNSDATKLYYDGLGRLKNVKDKDNREVSYDYDKLGRRTSLIYPDDTYVTYHYDKLSRLEDIKYDDNPGDANPAVVIAHYDYDALSRRTDLYYNYDGDSTYDDDNDNLDPEDDPIDYTNYDGHMKYDYEDKVETPTQTNNNLGNRLHIVDHDIDNDGTAELKHAYTYDAVGNRQSQVITDSTTVTHNYAYDNIYQLIQDSVTNSVYDYDYDALGNRNDIYYNSSIYEDYSTYDRTGTTDNYLNQYGSVGATSSSRHDYSYDANGNLVGIDTDDDSIDEIVYGYDAENRMTSAVTTTTNAAYTYDHAGRRISKTVGTTTTEYVYSGDQVIAEYVGSNWVRKFIYGSGIDEPIC